MRCGTSTIVLGYYADLNLLKNNIYVQKKVNFEKNKVAYIHKIRPD